MTTRILILFLGVAPVFLVQSISALPLNATNTTIASGKCPGSSAWIHAACSVTTVFTNGCDEV